MTRLAVWHFPFTPLGEPGRRGKGAKTGGLGERQFDCDYHPSWVAVAQRVTMPLAVRTLSSRMSRSQYIPGPSRT